MSDLVLQTLGSVTATWLSSILAGYSPCQLSCHTSDSAEITPLNDRLHFNQVGRGRVEIKAIDRASGRILAADRQTEVAVDLSEEVAGKSALEKASRAIAKRVIRRLSK